ncbi:MAG: LCP family protein [Clostridiales bacterium]|jgi:LCP family protein required for cell wall assembly|nr:LCP family protein [Clostridiales bacterium]
MPNDTAYPKSGGRASQLNSHRSDNRPDNRPDHRPDNDLGENDMARSQDARVRNLRKRLMKKFLFIVGTVLGIFLIAGGIGVFAYMKSTEADTNAFHTYDTPAPLDAADNDGQAAQVLASPTVAAPNFLLPPEKTNFLIVGEDESELLTDVILVGCFDRNAKDIEIISIPRDTRTVLPDERIQRMKELSLHPPLDGVMKMNAVHSYGGKKYGLILLREQLSDLLGITLDYYVEVNLKAFREIVDILGGVDMDIPKPGYYYKDPYQDLVIAVPSGLQHLDGKMAEGVVRYRATYVNGDVDRIEVQQKFLGLLFEQTLTKENLIENAPSIGKTILESTQTDFSLTDLPKYLQYLGDLNKDNIHFYTLPGSSDYIGATSYFVMDESETRTLIQDAFLRPRTEENGTDTADALPGDTNVSTNVSANASASASSGAPASSAKPKTVSSKGLSIEILNGAQKQGFAAEYKAKLEKDGFTITNVDNYTGDLTDNTRIYIRETGMGEDLISYFQQPDLIVKPKMPNDYDIIIIIGREEK